jgi:hypothetical protein
VNSLFTATAWGLHMVPRALDSLFWVHIRPCHQLESTWEGDLDGVKSEVHIVLTKHKLYSRTSNRYGAGCAASCALYSRPHFYTYWLTSYLADSLQNLGHHANRVEQGSTLCSSSFDALIKVYSAYRARHDDIRTIGLL